MSKIKYDADIMKIISIFENMTGAKIKDCIVDDKVLFIVEEQDMGKAIGRRGSNIQRLESMLNRRVKVVGFSHDVKQFVRNLLHPIQVMEITEEAGNITIKGHDTRTRALIIGRDRTNINHILNVANRFFSVGDIKVI